MSNTENDRTPASTGQDGGSKGIGEDPPRARAEHGYRNEVSWDGGKGRQPYANQAEAEGEEKEKGQPAGWPETEGGDRGEASGRTLEQMEEVRKKP
ncbi:MAG: hypothetical protein V4864_22690 [Pseudomonadota bacterium]